MYKLINNLRCAAGYAYTKPRGTGVVEGSASRPLRLPGAGETRGGGRAKGDWTG